MSTVEAPREGQREAETTFGMIDCDVHPYHVNGLDDLAPYLSAAWRRRLGIGDLPDWAKFINGGQVGMPKNEFYRISSGPLRTDSVPPEGGVPGSDPTFVAKQLLDEYGIDRAILLGGPNSGHGTFPNVVALAAICSAYNDWVIEHWCDVDERYRAAILIPPQDAELAVKEVERVADRPGVSAIHMPLFNIAPGERHYWPVYEAAQHYGLPILVHPGATEVNLRAGARARLHPDLLPRVARVPDATGAIERREPDLSRCLREVPQAEVRLRRMRLRLAGRPDVATGARLEGAA